MEITHYDAKRVSLKSCGSLGLRVVFDPQATDVTLTYSPDDEVAAKCSNGHLIIQGLGVKLDISGRHTQNTEVYGSLSDRAFNDGEVGAPASATLKTVTTRVYANGLHAVWTTVPEGGVVEIILVHNLQRKPRLTLTMPPQEAKPILIKVDGIKLY